ncbi:MAG: fructose-1,6-bisphosphatase [Muribaculaceae bacterium]|nr:fructose-1,6-bisphosphatase [Muribaculaceae bacterium]
MNPTKTETLTPQAVEKDRRILELLAQSFPNVSAASTEIINLEAILNLPKGTEHFVADLHGEYEAFRHILRNASGNIKRKVTEAFGTSLREADIRQLCSLIYYPERKLQLIRTAESDLAGFYLVTLHQLIKICQSVSSKYTRSKVRKALPKEFSYIIEELLHESPSDDDKQAYFQQIIETIISTGQADAFIVALCNVIQKLSIDQLHILGDIYDRGPGAHQIMEMLTHYPTFDIQWGNHDALWMGAAAGNDSCIANVLRISLRYDNMATIEEGYGINLVPLATFAMETYRDDPCSCFAPKLDPSDPIPSEKSLKLMAKMHKAISIIQFKLEAALIDKHPEWKMADRKLMGAIDFEKMTLILDGKEHPLNDRDFPTVDPADPYRLTAEEKELVEKLHHSFMISSRLQKHVKCLLTNGSLYGIYNSNLLYHASMPLNPDGTLKEVDLRGKIYKGRSLYNQTDFMMRAAFNSDTDAGEREYATDYYWYLWCGPDSILFDKSKMATFERYFLDDKETHKEVKGDYYRLRDNEEICDMILDEFGVEGDHRHIINGHVPVKSGKGESPIKANGKLMVIDGGFSKAYHHTTGTAGYTLVYHSRGFQLVRHEPFSSAEDAVIHGTDIVSTTQLVEMSSRRMRVRDTDKGKILQGQINELTELLYAFRHGIIKERYR